MSKDNSKPSAQRAELLALLERYDYSPATFDGLRSDCYEKAIAGHSLDALDSVYSLLLSGKPVEQLLADFPTWPAGTRFAGQLPGLNMLYEVKQRLSTEQTLNSLGQVAKFVGKLRERASGLPGADQPQVLDSVITLVGEELIQSRLGGGSIAKNLEVVDRLITAQSAKTHAQQEEVKIKLREKAEERQSRKLQLDVDKYLDLAAEKLLDASLRKRADEINASTLSQADKIRAMREAAFKDVAALQASGKLQIPKA